MSKMAMAKSDRLFGGKIVNLQKTSTYFKSGKVPCRRENEMGSVIHIPQGINKSTNFLFLQRLPIIFGFQ